MENNIAAKQLEINGLVQGVGFRPFLLNLAKQYTLTGTVSNTSSGVLAIIEGSLRRLNQFIHAVEKKKPVKKKMTGDQDLSHCYNHCYGSCNTAVIILRNRRQSDIQNNHRFDDRLSEGTFDDRIPSESRFQYAWYGTLHIL